MMTGNLRQKWIQFRFSDHLLEEISQQKIQSGKTAETLNLYNSNLINNKHPSIHPSIFLAAYPVHGHGVAGA